MDNRVENIIESLYLHASNKPHEIMYTFVNEDLTENNLTYLELLTKAQAIAATLQAKKIQPGCRVVLMYPPGLDFICGFLACLMAGVIAVPAFPPMNTAFAHKLDGILSDAKPSLILTETSIWKLISVLKLLKKIKKISFIQKYIEKKFRSTMAIIEFPLEQYTYLCSDKISVNKAKKFTKHPISSSDIALLQYTSGSTATPKGVMVLHKNIIANEKIIHHYFGHSQESVGVNWLPHFHDMGLIGTILQPLYVGFRSVLISPLTFLKKPTAWLSLIVKYGGTTSGAPNFAYQLCAQKYNQQKNPFNETDFQWWTVAFNGAEPIYAEALLAFYETFKKYGFKLATFLPCYGLAEATLMVAGIPYNEQLNIISVDMGLLKQNKVKLCHADTAKNLVSSGYCIEEIRIVNPDTHQEVMGDEIGEIWIHGDSVTHGYWQKPQETAEIFHAKIKEDMSDKKYLRSGDLGFIHDRQLYVTGRIKDVIIIDGENFYPQDIEYTVTKNFDVIRLGGVAAFVQEDETRSVIRVIAELRYDIREPALDLKAITDHMKQHVLKYNGVPVHQITLVNPKSIPKTTSGKISRARCKQLLLEGKIEIIFQA